MTHQHTNDTKDGSIKIGLFLNATYTVIEFTFGLLTGSLALIADATHNLTDTFTLGVSYAANRIARREATANKTFGYGRATILAALLNASVMIAVAVFITFEGVQRLKNPVAIEGGVVAAVASIGIVINGTIAYLLSKNRKDLNMRSAFIDMAFDALSSLGAVIAGLVMYFTHAKYIDSVVALLIAGLLLFNTIKILREAVSILLESTPKDIDIDELTASIGSHDKVLEVDDLHVWVIRSGYNALSCHIAIDEKQLVHSREIVEEIKQLLRNDYGIQHATIEVELEECRMHDEHETH